MRRSDENLFDGFERNMTRPHIYLPNLREITCLTDAIAPAPITAFVGGGGKTSSMLTMGTELAQRGKQTILTTTTRIYPFEEPLPERLRCVGLPAQQGKLRGVDNPDALKRKCDFLLIEADGSRGLPIKAPAAHEPVLTAQTGLVIAVMGLTGVGKPIAQVCHRPERVCEVLSMTPEQCITPEAAASLIWHESGLRKGVHKRRFAVILNQADSREEKEAGVRIAACLPDAISCVLTTYREETTCEY